MVLLHQKDCRRKPRLVQLGARYVSRILWGQRPQGSPNTVASKKGDGNLVSVQKGRKSGRDMCPPDQDILRGRLMLSEQRSQ